MHRIVAWVHVYHRLKYPIQQMGSIHQPVERGAQNDEFFKAEEFRTSERASTKILEREGAA